MELSHAWQSASAAGFLWGWVTENMTALFPFSSVFAKGENWGPAPGDLGVVTKPELEQQNASSYQIIIKLVLLF